MSACELLHTSDRQSPVLSAPTFHLSAGRRSMSPFVYLKAVAGAVGANVFPPLADYAVSFMPVPGNVRTALAILLIALLTGGVVYQVPNQQGPSPVPPVRQNPGLT